MSCYNDFVLPGINIPYRIHIRTLLIQKRATFNVQLNFSRVNGKMATNGKAIRLETFTLHWRISTIRVGHS